MKTRKIATIAKSPPVQSNPFTPNAAGNWIYKVVLPDGRFAYGNDVDECMRRAIKPGEYRTYQVNQHVGLYGWGAFITQSIPLQGMSAPVANLSSAYEQSSATNQLTHRLAFEIFRAQKMEALKGVGFPREIDASKAKHVLKFKPKLHSRTATLKCKAKIKTKTK